MGELVGRLVPLNERADILVKPWDELRDKDFATLDVGGSVGIDADDDDHHHHHEGHGHSHRHDDGHGHSHIHPDVDTITIEPKNFDEKSVRGLEGMLKDGVFGEVYRIKGKVLYSGEPKMLQGVFDTLRIESPPPGGPCRLVFIGNGLEEKNIARFWGNKGDADRRMTVNQ